MKTIFEMDNAITPTNRKSLMRGRTETAYLRSHFAKLDNYIKKHPEWDKHAKIKKDDNKNERIRLDDLQ